MYRHKLAMAGIKENKMTEERLDIYEFLDTNKHKGYVAFRDGWKLLIDENPITPGFLVTCIKYIEQFKDNLIIHADLTGYESESVFLETLQRIEDDSLKFKKQQHMN